MSENSDPNVKNAVVCNVARALFFQCLESCRFGDLRRDHSLLSKSSKDQDDSRLCARMSRIVLTSDVFCGEVCIDLRGCNVFVT